jgi:hypothetical protein
LNLCYRQAEGDMPRNRCPTLGQPGINLFEGAVSGS